jgi:hypothetical protein
VRLGDESFDESVGDAAEAEAAGEDCGIGGNVFDGFESRGDDLRVVSAIEARGNGMLTFVNVESAGAGGEGASYEQRLLGSVS